MSDVWANGFYACEKGHNIGSFVMADEITTEIHIPDDCPWSDNEARIAECKLIEGEPVSCPYCESNILKKDLVKI